MAQKSMNLETVKNMVTNYKTKQYLSIVTNTINPMKFDAQSAWFDLQSLKEFINSIEIETGKHPEYGMHGFGVRFYYSAYPDSDLLEESGGIPSNYEKLHTLVAVPTATIKGIDQDFDPCDPSTYDGKMPQPGALVKIMAENHGKLTPPGSGTGLWF